MRTVALLALPLCFATGCAFESTLMLGPAGERHRCEVRLPVTFEASSVRGDGKRVRITTQLIETRAQTHLWSGSYDRDLRDVLNVQSEVARQVGKALALELLPEDSSKSFAFEASRTRAV